MEEARKLDVMGRPLLAERKVGRATFIGDTHCAEDVTKEILKRYFDESDLLVFLGDYVDRGKTGVQNLETILLKLLERPDKVIMLRGNHESPLANQDRYLKDNFFDEVSDKFGSEEYLKFKEFFQNLPYAVVVNRYLCVHGGIARKINKVQEISQLPFPDEVPNDPNAFELLWNDPDPEHNGFSNSQRGPGTFRYGRDAVEKFLQENNLIGIIRAHEVVLDGIRENFDGKVYTIFSSKYHAKRFSGARAGVLLFREEKLEKASLDVSGC
ncbi:MAG: metallophosphoesterase [Nitrososphaerales archaeon]